MLPATVQCKTLTASHYGRTGSDGWADEVRKPMLAMGIAFGAVTMANASFAAKRRPELVPLVEGACSETMGMRGEKGLPPIGKARIMVALHGMDAPESVLRSIATNMNYIARNAPGGEGVVGEMVQGFSDRPYAAAVLTNGLRMLSESMHQNAAHFQVIATEFIRLTPPAPAPASELPAVPNPLMHFPVTSLMLLKKVAEVMFREDVPAITYMKLSRSESAREALEGLDRWFPNAAGGQCRRNSAPAANVPVPRAPG